MTARKPRARPEASVDLAAYELGDDAPPTPEQLLAQFFGQAQEDDIVCTVYERPADQKGMSYLFSFPLAAGMLAHELYETILQKYGPGNYELHAQKGDGKLVKRLVFQVGTERERKRAIIPDRQRPDEPARVAPAAGASGDISPALAAILDNQNRMLERLLEAQTDRPRERDTLSMARELLELKNLFGPAQSTPVAEIFSIVKDVLKLKDELSDGGEDSSPLAVAMKQLAPAITRAVDKLSQAPAPPARAAGPAGVRPAVPAAAQPPANGNNGDFSMNFDAVFLELAAHADRGSAPPDVADAVLDWLAERPAWIEQAVLGMVMDEQERVVGRIVGSYPKLEGKREWLGEVIQALIAKVEQAELEGAGGTGELDDAGSGKGVPAGAGAT